ncbi:AAA family ATPase [Proteiniphilum saccharofermentans]|uniref:AAA family ATPase n=1 Tax=Proteiniphilum saccharofermentans TaxID=1642647 RepID=UPI001587B3C1|nr:AAA family ATPase [Proteiniphilum saccharofermentans]
MESKKPLIIYGARQVGKTYLIKEFGKTEYRQMVYINFERTKEMQGIFLQDLDPKRLITAFELYAGIKITSEDTLIVLDEIQAAAQGLTSLKYFYEASCKHNVIFYISTTNLIMCHCIGKFLYFMYHCIGTCSGRKKCL